MELKSSVGSLVAALAKHGPEGRGFGPSLGRYITYGTVVSPLISFASKTLPAFGFRTRASTACSR